MTKVNNRKTHKYSKQKQQKIDLKCFSIEELYQKAIKAYQENDTSSQDRWNTMLAQSGTKKDKISAAGVLILQNPQSSLKYFDLMIKWCFDKNHNFAITACQAMANIFNDHVFVGKSALSSFVDAVQGYIKDNKKNSQVTNAQLVVFYIQSQFKQYYSQFIKSVQILLNDQLNHIKKSCIKLLGGLARHKQLRRTILSLIINKLGDTDMQVVNQVSKCLKDQFYQDILASQTLMQQTQTFLFRSNLPHKAQFFVINFLNSINLKYLNQKSMYKLFQIFYHFFTKCISTQQNNDQLSSRLFLNSIKGLNRVFSFMKGGSKQTKKIVQQKIQNVYKIVHTTPNTKAKIQLLLFLFQSHAYLHGNLSTNNRFYRVLYQFIGNDQIIHSSLSQMFFDLVLVCMRQDQNLNRVLAMAKRMLQLCFAANSNFIITTLLMLDKVIQGNQGFKIFMSKSQNAMNDEPQNIQKYDSNKRDPLFAGAEKTCLWQLKALNSHFHPTVRKFSGSIISGQPIQYQGNNPLLQFNLTSFIQKMSLRKQKKSQAWRIKVKRSLPKIRSSKYETLLNKNLQEFKQSEQFIKKYLQRRNQIHTNRRKIQTNDIEQFADQVIQKQMDRLNPQQIDQQLSITPVGSEQDAQDYQGDQGEEFNDQQLENEEIQDEDLMNDQNEGDQIQDDLQQQDMQQSQNQFDQDNQSGMQQKQFQDVFDEINQQDSYPNKSKNKNKNRGAFNNKKKHISKKPQKNKFNKNGNSFKSKNGKKFKNNRRK